MVHPTQNKTTEDNNKKGTMLPKDFTPQDYHVIIGRGKKIANHKGNRALRTLVESKVEAYQEADKTSKSFLLVEVVHRIEKQSPDGVCFVKFDTETKRWFAAPRNLSRMNVAQAFRDYLSPSYRSSKHSKRERRMQEKVVEEEPSIADINSGNTANKCGSGADFQPDRISIVSALVDGRAAAAAAAAASSHHHPGSMTTHQTLMNLRCQGALPTPPERRALYHYIEDAMHAIDEHQSAMPVPTMVMSHQHQHRQFLPAPAFSSAPISIMPVQQQQQRRPQPAPLDARDLLLAPLPPDDDDDDEPLNFLGNHNEDDFLPLYHDDREHRQQCAFDASENSSAFFLQGMHGSRAAF